MNDSITKLSLNLQESDILVSVRAKRGDTGRTLQIHLSDGALPYEITQDCYAVFTARKEDGTCLHHPCTIRENFIEYPFTSQTCSSAGTHRAEIQLYGGDGRLITSALFLLTVYETVYDQAASGDSQEQISTLEDLIARANRLVQREERYLCWLGIWNPEAEYRKHDLVLREDILYVAEEVPAVGDLPGGEDSRWRAIAGMGTSGTPDLAGYATEQWVREGYQPKGSYLTQHQDISGKLDASALPGAITTALAQAKESGAFDGADGYTPRKGIDYFDGEDGSSGPRGVGILKVTTAPSSYTTATAGKNPIKRMKLSTIISEADVDEVLIGDQVANSYYHYHIYYVDETYAYMDVSQSIRGKAGEDGKDGTDGIPGTSLNITTYETSDGRNGMTFETTDYLPDGTPVTQSYGSIEDGKDYILTESDKAEIVSIVIETIGGNPIYGVVDTNNHIVLNGNLSDGNYAVKYEMEDGTTVNIGNLVLDSNVYYTVTSNLTQCTNSNSAARVVQGGSYSATITPESGYTLSNIKVTMDGADISSSAVSGSRITIANVTGNILITAVAEKTTTSYTSQFVLGGDGYILNGRCSSTGADRTDANGCFVSNYIKVSNGDTVYTNIPIGTSYSGFKLSDGSTSAAQVPSDTTKIKNYSVTNGISKFTINLANVEYVRIQLVLNLNNKAITDMDVENAGVIITVNEPIT